MGQLVRGAPGLYLQGMPSEPVLQLTAVTGFVGITERGPVHRAEPIRNWDEYLTVFGQPVDHAFLPNAVFGFHAAWNYDDSGHKVTSVSATQTLMDVYPPTIRSWISRRGGLSPHMKYLRGRQLAGMYRSCQ